MNAAADLPHVLVVDDNPDASEVLALLIETEGFTAATAATLAQAREQVASHRPDLVFLDLNLPDGNGIDLLAELKNDQTTSSIKVVLLSGLLKPHLKDEAHLLGASAVLLKPLDHGQLSAALDHAR
ncbi:response regulator [Roseateles cellulosilyticus]|uniref:Response regulator n=1 Tax=Pelomonas cellulosilytica TaxID=2906762 RepID=A0ABS8Y293_9BURK|nr:response regulator [Pelomonas sp. P8]MCE4557785.1 response regulator [Pelomonas sp. P8]